MAIYVHNAPVEMAHVGNEIYVTLRTDLPLNTANLRLRLELVVETDYYVGSNEVILLEPRKPDANGRVRFHVHDHLRDFFYRKEDVPTEGGTVAARCNNLIRRWGYRGVELSGTTPAVTDFVPVTPGPVYTTWFYAFNGGISKDLWYLKPYFNTSGWFQTMVPTPFYDWAVDNVRTGRAQDQWVYLFYGKVFPGMTFTENFYFTVRVNYEDGTFEGFSTTPVAIQAAQVWMMPCGFEQLGIPALETAAGVKCVSYRIRAAYGSGSIYGPYRTFVVDNGYYEWETELQYVNGLGAFSQLLLRGRPMQETSVESETATAYHELNMEEHMGDTTPYDMVVHNGVSHRTGVLNAQELRKVREMLASRKVMVKDALLGWVPVKTLNVKEKQNPLENVNTVELSYEPDRIDAVVNMF